MAFVPSTAPWFAASPFGRVYPLASTAEVSKFATGDIVGLPRASNFNVMLGISKSTRKDGTPTLHAANWTWLGDGSSMQWIQQDSGGELVPILGGTAAWFFEHFVHRRGDLKKISAESLRKLLAGNVTSHGAAVAGIGQRGQSKWTSAHAPVDPVLHVRHFLASLDAEGPHATAACHCRVLLPRTDICARIAADWARDAQSSRDVGGASAPPGVPQLVRAMLEPAESTAGQVVWPTAAPSCALMTSTLREFGGVGARYYICGVAMCTKWPPIHCYTAQKIRCAAGGKGFSLQRGEREKFSVSTVYRTCTLCSLG